MKGSKQPSRTGSKSSKLTTVKSKASAPTPVKSSAPPAVGFTVPTAVGPPTPTAKSTMPPAGPIPIIPLFTKIGGRPGGPIVNISPELLMGLDPVEPIEHPPAPKPTTPSKMPVEVKEEALPEERIPLYTFIILIICELCGIICIGLTIYWAVTYLEGFSFKNNDSYIEWHAILMTIGAVIIPGHTIFSYRVIPSDLNRLDKVHTGLAFLSIFVSSCGILCAFFYHSTLNPPLANFYSLHSWVGFVAYWLLVFQVLISFVCFVKPGIPGALKQLHQYHVTMVLGIFFLAVMSAVGGFAQKAVLDIRRQKRYPNKLDYTQLGPEAVVANLAAMFLVLFTVFAAYIFTATSFYTQGGDTSTTTRQ